MDRELDNSAVSARLGEAVGRSHEIRRKTHDRITRKGQGPSRLIFFLRIFTTQQNLRTGKKIKNK